MHIAIWRVSDFEIDCVCVCLCVRVCMGTYSYVCVCVFEVLFTYQLALVAI